MAQCANRVDGGGGGGGGGGVALLKVSLLI